MMIYNLHSMAKFSGWLRHWNYVREKYVAQTRVGPCSKINFRLQFSWLRSFITWLLSDVIEWVIITLHHGGETMESKFAMFSRCSVHEIKLYWQSKYIQAFLPYWWYFDRDFRRTTPGLSRILLIQIPHPI